MIRRAGIVGMALALSTCGGGGRPLTWEDMPPVRVGGSVPLPVVPAPGIMPRSRLPPP